MDAEVVRLRTRKERSADGLLQAAERLKSAMGDLEVVAGLTVREAVDLGIPSEHIEALLSAADLVVRTSDVLATTLMVGVDSALK